MSVDKRKLPFDIRKVLPKTFGAISCDQCGEIITTIEKYDIVFKYCKCYFVFINRITKVFIRGYIKERLVRGKRG